MFRTPFWQRIDDGFFISRSRVRLLKMFRDDNGNATSRKKNSVGQKKNKQTSWSRRRQLKSVLRVSISGLGGKGGGTARLRRPKGKNGRRKSTRLAASKRAGPANPQFRFADRSSTSSRPTSVDDGGLHPTGVDGAGGGGVGGGDAGVARPRRRRRPRRILGRRSRRLPQPAPSYRPPMFPVFRTGLHGWATDHFHRYRFGKKNRTYFYVKGLYFLWLRSWIDK